MSQLELLQLGWNTMFTWDVMIILGVSLIIGIVSGSIPGLSSSNTCAIMLPMTLGMSTAGALVFMSGIYVGCQYGGSIPAILINTPGTAGAGATTLDGYPLAQQGKADYALGLSLTSSALAGIVASIACLFIIKPVSKVALSFGPAEIFLLALVGITIIVGVSDKSPAMGLLAGLIGILIGTMPADLTLGRPRANFGFLELYDEFPSITAMLGLFAFSSLLLLTDGGPEQIRQKVGDFKQIWAGTVRTIKEPFCMTLSTIIGLFVGVLPGAGIDVGSFLAYSQARLWSKHPEDFGHGSAEGVIAPEAANNAVASGVMVPTMTLGIPGSATGSVILAALVMHGVRPGPQVMREYPGPVYAMMLAIVVCSFLTWIIGFFYTKMAVKLAGTRNQYLIPATLALCLIGAFATRMFTFDMWLFIIFGIIGYILTSSGFPYVPLVLGIVLGAMAEGYFMIAINISKGDYRIFFRSVFAWIMWGVILMVLLVPVITPIVKKYRKKQS
jgi:putative tricarboxylic transport membrane protein